MALSEVTLRNGQQALIELRFTFVEDLTPTIDAVDRALIGLSFVLACLPCDQRSLAIGESGGDR